MPEPRMPYYPALDGVRAYCILLVLYDHLKSNGHTLTWLNGHLGVDLFFLLSGYLITTLLAREQTLTGTLNLRAFYWRRLFRLAPVYFVVFALYVAATHLPHQQLKWQQLRHALPYFLTLLNEYAPGTVFTHTWSLGVEEKFYLLWPPLAFLLARTPRARSILLTALIGLTAIPPLLGHGYLARAYFGLLTGCALSLALASFSTFHNGQVPSRLTIAIKRIPPALLVALFALGFYAEHVSKALFPVFAVTSSLLIAHLVTRRTWLTRLHEWPPLRWLGRRSYAMYLVHILCLNAIETHIPITSGAQALLAFAAATALTAAAAEVLYRIVENPARQAGLAWLASRESRLPTPRPSS